MIVSLHWQQLTPISIYLARGKIVSTQEKRRLINDSAGIVANKFTRVSTDGGGSGARWFTTVYTGWCLLDAWTQAKPGEISNCNIVIRTDPNIGDPNMNAYLMVYANIGIDVGEELIMSNY